jgi:purine-nucleoside phosphorylase
MEEIVLPVRTMGLLGIEYLFLTNASGGINADFHPGDIVTISDHINLSGRNPLVGPNLAELGPRFPDMGNAYDKELRELLHQVGKNNHVDLKSGVYCSVLGPTYETPAEIRMLRIIGADLVGMSTVPEVIAANHLGLKVAGVACITNYAAGIKQEKLSHADVKKVAEKAMVGFATVLTETIGELKKSGKV